MYQFFYKTRKKVTSHFMASKQESENITNFQGNFEAFKALVEQSNDLIVANFWAQWCAPCRRLAGMMPQMASENPKVKFIKIDVDDNPELTEYYGITGIPNVRLFKGVDNQKGPIQVDEIQGLDNTALRDVIQKHSK